MEECIAVAVLRSSGLALYRSVLFAGHLTQSVAAIGKITIREGLNHEIQFFTPKSHHWYSRDSYRSSLLLGEW